MGYGQTGKAPDSESGKCRFEPYYPNYKKFIRQSFRKDRLFFLSKIHYLLLLEDWPLYSITLKKRKKTFALN